MTTTASYFDRKPNTNVRPGISHLQADPASPHTPQRTFSSAFSSPSLSYRAEEEVLVFEFGARHLSAGISGDSNPRCTLAFSPEDGRRVGDYRRYMPEYEDRPRKRKRDYKWGEDHELWRMDLRDVDLGLVEDKVERVVREAYTKYLLLDSKNKRLVLVLPSLMPHRILSSVLSCIFANFQTPSITLFSSPILNVTAAGCRAGLVVDIGWAETVMTAVYEHREVLSARTTRAMKLVTRGMADLLKEYAQGGRGDRHSQEQTASDENHPADSTPSDSRYFDFAEEVSSRTAWCPFELRHTSTTTRPSGDPQVSGQPEEANDTPPKPPDEAQDQTIISIPSPLRPCKTLRIPIHKLAEPVENSLFAPAADFHDLDDHEQPLPHLLYRTLLSLPPDVRSQCMARIIITGGGSNIPGVKSRLLNELKSVVEHRGWDPVYGHVAVEARQYREKVRNTRLSRKDGKQNSTTASAAAPPKTTSAPTHLQPQTDDPIADQLAKQKSKRAQAAAVAGEIRGVETLGAWVGGSLVASLKVKGVVEVEREAFLAHGLAGAKRESELVQATQAAQRMSLGGRGVSGLGEKEKGGWTLGSWA